MQKKHDFSFMSALPFPKVTVTEENSIYGKMMLDNMGGNCSEMSAISLYFYNNLCTDKYDDLPFIFHKISIAEMYHLEVFGMLAKQLGQDPRLWTWNGRGKHYWSPAYNYYPIELSEILLNSINGEKVAIEKYNYQLELIKDENICASLKRIILDEEIHVAIFKQLYQEYCQ